MHVPCFSRIFLLILQLCWINPAYAAPQPLWEIGAGIGTVSTPDYRGSDRRGSTLVPIPYFVYRGEIFKADRSGVRAALLARERLELNLSANLSLVPGNRDNPERQGMPALRSVAEIGPTADFTLWRSADRLDKLALRLPLRAAVTVASKPQHIGWLFSPNLQWSMADARGWKFSLQAGPIYASRAFHSYHYAVTPAQATIERPAYAAAGGYSGMQATAILSRRFAHIWSGAYLRYDNLNGATFINSPLVRQRDAVAAGIAFAWVFGTSSTMVETPD